jgi:hypothetical protein
VPIPFVNGEIVLESAIRKNGVVTDLSENRELGWLKKEAEESVKTCTQLRKLLMIREPSSP